MYTPFDCCYTYDADLALMLAQLGYNYAYTLTRNGRTAYLYDPDDPTLGPDFSALANEYGELNWGALYYSMENQFGY